MKRKFLVSIFACVMVLLNLIITSTAQAQPLMAIAFPGLQDVELTAQQKDLLQQLETDILPQLESILSPEQRDKFETEVSDGTSFRKVFKSLSLTPEQKAQLGTLFKSLPKKDIFTSLTPEQKKQLFMKKKEFFKPTPEEISERIKKGQE